MPNTLGKTLQGMRTTAQAMAGAWVRAQEAAAKSARVSNLNSPEPETTGEDIAAKAPANEPIVLGRR